MKTCSSQETNQKQIEKTKYAVFPPKKKLYRSPLKENKLKMYRYYQTSYPYYTSSAYYSSSVYSAPGYYQQTYQQSYGPAYYGNNIW